MEKQALGSKGLPEQINELIDRCFGNPLPEDPDTTGWGADEAGFGWFNTTEKVPKFWDGTQIVEIGTSTHIYKETATIPVGQTSVVVTHNLGFIPKVSVTPKTNLNGRDFWVPESSKTSTQFTIYISSPELPNGPDHSFDVRAS